MSTFCEHGKGRMHLWWNSVITLNSDEILSINSCFFNFLSQHAVTGMYYYYLNPYSAELYPFKSWRLKGFVQFGIIINVLVTSF